MMDNTKNNAHYGINIRKYCAEHEEYVQKYLSSGDNLEELLILHACKIGWLQHERLIHLIVMLLISVLFLFSIWLYIVMDNPLVFILIAIVLVLLSAYIRHYFFLENKVQHWYKMYDRIYEKRQ